MQSHALSKDGEVEAEEERESKDRVKGRSTGCPKRVGLILLSYQIKSKIVIFISLGGRSLKSIHLLAYQHCK